MVKFAFRMPSILRTITPSIAHPHFTCAENLPTTYSTIITISADDDDDAVVLILVGRLVLRNTHQRSHRPRAVIKYPIINEISNALCYTNVTYNRLVCRSCVYVREKVCCHRRQIITANTANNTTESMGLIKDADACCMAAGSSPTIENVYNNSASNIIAQHARIVSCIMTIGIGYVETTQCTSG
uniref:Uncharacterized protein n=1 Tax=Glossina palpalis gambiensis TaxID=67801 RepID=A0A1B0B658_9MUSC